MDSFSMCVWGVHFYYLFAGVHAHRTHAEKPEDNVKELVISIESPEIKIRSTGLAASDFTH